MNKIKELIQKLQQEREHVFNYIRETVKVVLGILLDFWFFYLMEDE